MVTEKLAVIFMKGPKYQNTGMAMGAGSSHKPKNH